MSKRAGFCLICGSDRPCGEGARCKTLSKSDYRKEYARLWHAVHPGYQRDYVARKDAGLPTNREIKREKRRFEYAERAAAWSRMREIQSVTREEERMIQESREGLRKLEAEVEAQRAIAKAETVQATQQLKIQEALERAERTRQKRLEIEAKREAAKAEYDRLVASRNAGGPPKTSPAKLAQVKVWRTLHPERVRKIRNRSYEKHREETSIRAALYQTAHPEVHAEKCARRRSLINAPAADREEVKAYYRFVKDAPRLRCYWCKSVVPKGDRTVDHIIPLAKDGQHSVPNLCCACLSCNSSKSAKDPIEFAGQAELNFASGS